MKFKDPITGEYKELSLKTGDTLPIGTIVSFEGDEIPEGYEEVIGEEARVVISPTEPTTGEEVWIQKSKNLLNYNNLTTQGLNHKTISENGEISNKSSSDNRTWNFNNVDWKINLKPGTYTVSVNFSQVDTHGAEMAMLLENGDAIFWSDSFQVSNVSHKSYTFTLTKNTNIGILFKLYDGICNIQIEQGESATSYEPYTDKKIYTKNDNGVYEEFYDENNLDVYSSSEQRIGTFLGKPLYRLVAKFTMYFDEAFYTTYSGASNIIKNIENLIRYDMFVENGTVIVPTPNGDECECYTYIQRSYGGVSLKATANSVDKFREKKATIILEYTKTTD